MVVQKTAENNAKQTFPYVEYVMNLLLDHGFFDNYPKITMHSDGCGKHFKAYITQSFMCLFQERMRARLSPAHVCDLFRFFVFKFLIDLFRLFPGRY